MDKKTIEDQKVSKADQIILDHVESNNLTVDEIKELRDKSNVFFQELLDNKPLREKVLEYVYHYLRSL